MATRGASDKVVVSRAYRGDAVLGEKALEVFVPGGKRGTEGDG